MADKEEIQDSKKVGGINTTEQIAERKPSPSTNSKFSRFKHWYGEHKKWTILLTVLLLVVLVILIPWTRYKVFGLFVSQDYSIQVMDSETNTPVSGADVSMDLKTVKTDSNGKAIIKEVSVGPHSLLVHKKYYSDVMTEETVPVIKQKSAKVIKFTATGRQAKITVKNLVSQTPVANVSIKVADVSSTTDANGETTVVLPTGISSEKATLSLDGYNDSEVTVKVSDKIIENNQFNLTPAGKIYFLSKLSGKIDVVKTNLDGSDRKTVLAGTGNEDEQGTVLLASRDWKYLALLSRRAGSSSTLYLIDTSDDSLTTMDEGSATFTLVGWVGHKFVYTVNRNNINDWKSGKEVLKSYNAENKQITLLDQTSGSGNGQYDYIRETFGAEYALNNDEVVYSKNWISAFNYANESVIANKQATFNSILPDGSNHKLVKGFSLAPGTQSLNVGIDIKPNKPDSVYIKFEDGTKANLYEYVNSQVNPASTITEDTFYSTNYPTYLTSPSGNETFWVEPRDGKNSLFIGNQDGDGGKQIAKLSDYNNYGWYSGEYLLVSKNSSELYIMSKDGSKPAVKITDYHKPAQSYYGYGGGYGGL